jgi:hypothetical protein
MRLIHQHQRPETVQRRLWTAGQSDLATTVDRESRHLSATRFHGRDPAAAAAAATAARGRTDRLLVGYPIGVWLLGGCDTRKAAVASGIRCDIRFHRLRRYPVIPVCRATSAKRRQTDTTTTVEMTSRRHRVPDVPMTTTTATAIGRTYRRARRSSGHQPQRTNGRTDRRTDGWSYVCRFCTVPSFSACS